jgi:BirA family transcriptional regulator, biotin operon repressor / biotin---[acetyl-CoA-carboxylase] ligase
MPDDSTSPTPRLDIAALENALQPLRLGTPLIYFPALPSTNTYAAELARQGAPEGTLVTTDDQTAGRGRVGRAWKSLPGQQLVMSLVLRPAFPPHFLVMASALGVAEAIEEVAGLHADIKWPNDVQITTRKVSGILIETSPGYAVLGIGVNVNGSLAGDPELGARATTLADAVGHTIARETLAAALLRRLDALTLPLTQGGMPARAALRAAWRARLTTRGQRITIAQQATLLSGVAEDVDTDGALLLRLDDGALRAVTWGDVSL